MGARLGVGAAQQHHERPNPVGLGDLESVVAVVGKLEESARPLLLGPYAVCPLEQGYKEGDGARGRDLPADVDGLHREAREGGRGRSLPLVGPLA